jgi:hypothetical protein
MENKFQIFMMGELNFFLGIKVKDRRRRTRGEWESIKILDENLEYVPNRPDAPLF